MELPRDHTRHGSLSLTPNPWNNIIDGYVACILCHKLTQTKIYCKQARLEKVVQYMISPSGWELPVSTMSNVFSLHLPIEDLPSLQRLIYSFYFSICPAFLIQSLLAHYHPSFNWHRYQRTHLISIYKLSLSIPRRTSRQNAVVPVPASQMVAGCSCRCSDDRDQLWCCFEEERRG